MQILFYVGLGIDENYKIVACVASDDFDAPRWSEGNEQSWDVVMTGELDSSSELSKLMDFNYKPLMRITLEAQIGTPQYGALINHPKAHRFIKKIKGRQYARPILIRMVEAVVEGTYSHYSETDKEDVTSLSLTIDVK